MTSCGDMETLRLFVNERLTAVAEDILAVFVTTIVQYQQHIEVLQNSMIPRTTPDFLPVLCEEEDSIGQQKRRRRSPGLVQEEPEPPYVKEEQEELLRRPVEERSSALPAAAVKSEDRHAAANRELQPAVAASTSTSDHATKAQAERVIGDFGGGTTTSQPNSDVQLLSSRCSESGTEDSDEWEETIREDQSEALNAALMSPQTTRYAEQEQGLSFSSVLFQDAVSSPPTMCQTAGGGRHFSCTVCGKIFKQKGHLKRHVMIHTGEKPFNCIVCGKSFNQNGSLKMHMRIHTGEKPYECSVCGKIFIRNEYLKIHMRIHLDRNASAQGYSTLNGSEATQQDDKSPSSASPNNVGPILDFCQ